MPPHNTKRPHPHPHPHKPTSTSSSSSSSSSPTPTTLLSESITHEESGDKHRAGDAAKAARFYTKALAGYEEGLRLLDGSGSGSGSGSGGGSGGGGNHDGNGNGYGNNGNIEAGAKANLRFDMAYNLARLQYQITQTPSILAQFPAPTPLHHLRQALLSHRRALALDLDPNRNAENQQNADLLFNTAQVLSSLAEAIDNGGNGASAAQGSGDDEEAIAAYQEAVEFFQRCLMRQEVLFQEAKAMRESAEAGTMVAGDDVLCESDKEMKDDVSEPTTSQSREEEQWATIVEPVTKQSLLDTVFALLDALGSMSLLLRPGDGNTSETIEDLGTKLIAENLPLYLEDMDVEAESEAWLAIAKFKAAILEASLKQKRTDPRLYDQRLNETFFVSPEQESRIGLLTKQSYLCTYADALTDFAAATAEYRDVGTLRWSRLTNALDKLTTVTKLSAVDDMATVHIGRGDTELLRFMLCRSGDLPENLSNDKVQLTLLKNSSTYYRGAASVLRGSIMSVHDQRLSIASVKNAVVIGIMDGNKQSLLDLRAGGVSEKKIEEILQDMVDESLLSAHILQKAGLLS